MVGAQAMNQTKMQAAIKVTKVVVQAKEVDGEEVGIRLRSEAYISKGPQKGTLSLKQPSFNWSAPGKYAELRNFMLEAKTFFKHIIQIRKT